LELGVLDLKVKRGIFLFFEGNPESWDFLKNSGTSDLPKKQPDRELNKGSIARTKKIHNSTTNY